MKNSLRFAVAVVWLTVPCSLATADTAYEVPSLTAGTQNFGGALGMDFDVNDKIQITRLGVFDDDSDGLNLAITARLYNRQTQLEVASIPFSTGTTGSLEGGSRFLDLPSPILLDPGFQGTIVAEGYGGTELNGNSGTPVWTTNDGGGLLSFVGSGRFNLTAGLFPGTPDGGPENRYAAGTFGFEADAGRADSAYIVPAGVAGNQAFGGSLGMDFAVNEAATITRLGVFDDLQDGLNRTITARVYNRANQVEVASLIFNTGSTGELVGGSRFLDLADALRLPAGFQGTIVAENYGTGERNGNVGTPIWTTDDGGGLLSFVGTSRFGGAGAFPTSLGTVENQFAAGTFSFAADTDLIAYENFPGQAGNQQFGGSLGMDFDVNEAVSITRLGVFDDNSDGLNRTITARVYNRANGVEVASLVFNTGATGDLLGGSRFLDLAEPLHLPAGFQGTIVAENYGTGERNGNLASPPWTTVDGAGLLSFVGTSRFGGAGAFPTSLGTVDNQFAAGTFGFAADNQLIAYEVFPGVSGNQTFGGSLGMDFDVTSGGAQVKITHLGVFDSGQDGLALTITAHLYDRNSTGAPIATLTFNPGDGELIGGSRFLELTTPLILPAGFLGTIVAEGYGVGEPNGNIGAGTILRDLNDGDGALTFTGTSRFGVTPGLYPGSPDAGPANRYAAGTFLFAIVPEPGTAVLVLLGALGLGTLRRRRERM